MLHAITPGLYLHVGSIGTRSCLAGFDLGGTIIRTNKSNFKGNTWEWEFMPNSLSVLKYYRDNGYTLVIFSNQNYEGDDLFYAMIRNDVIISTLISLDINPWFLISTQQDIYRKPNTGMWDIFTHYYTEAMTLLNDNNLCQHMNPLGLINRQLSFFTGDSAGRSEDRTSNDKDFAQNVGVRFYTPEQIFLR